MTHTITPKINRFGEAAAESVCDEPPDAWCRINLKGPDDDPDEPPLDPADYPGMCWFTVLADGRAPFGKVGMYDGPPTELRPGPVEFAKVEDRDEDYCHWHYAGDTGGHDYDKGAWEDQCSTS